MRGKESFIEVNYGTSQNWICVGWAVVSIATVTAVAAAFQSHSSNGMTLKITWNLSPTTNPNITRQIASQCRM